MAVHNTEMAIGTLATKMLTLPPSFCQVWGEGAVPPAYR